MSGLDSVLQWPGACDPVTAYALKHPGTAWELAKEARCRERDLFVMGERFSVLPPVDAKGAELIAWLRKAYPLFVSHTR